jgi:2-dehydro-3-deoxyphosphogluconate aldolase/(4S)-4-hydroxy-2-oxoglutarate aldolase
VIAAGAQFVVSPTLEPAVIRVCRDHNIPCVAGAFTPTEMLAAWRAGASLVKLFPASAGGPGFLHDVLTPLPFLRVVPSGGVSLANAADWIRAGAAAVSAGSALLGARDLTAAARALVAAVAAARRPPERAS